MGKIHSVTSIITIVFLLLAIPLVLYPVLFQGQTFNQTYEANKGLIWFVGLLSATGLSVLTFIGGVHLREQKRCLDLSNKKSAQLEEQNEKIIFLQERMMKHEIEHTSEVRKLHDAINRNTEKDNETVSSINKLSAAIDKFSSEISNIQKKVSAQDRKLRAHDKQLRALKK